MPQSLINIGASPNDGTGDSLRTAFGKANANFTDLYQAVAGKQAGSAILTGIAVTTPVADQVIYATGSATFGTTALTAYARTFMGAISASAARTALGLGGSAVLNVGTAAGTVADGGALTSEIARATAAEATKAAKGANTDITSLAGLTTALSVGQGGTGATTTSSARAALSAAASGANNDITSLVGLTTPLSGGQGGTGYTSVTGALDGLFSSTQGAILYRGGSAWLALPPGTLGQVLTTGGAGASPAWATPASGGATTPSVRQTAYTGPRNTDGSPSFLPAATSGTLTLTAQNVSASAPLGITAAQGSGATPNVSTSLTSNPTWTLGASATNYLFLNASTGVTFVSTLQPIYQFGGTPSTANGQFTFDYAAMVGYLGNGTAAVATPLVAVGEAVTSSTAVTSTVAYAYNGYYDAGLTAGLPTSAVTKASNLGVYTETPRLILRCTTADQGYAVGDQIIAGVGQVNTQYAPITPFATRNTIGLGASLNWYASNKSSGVVGALTPGNWSYKLVAARGW